jgi:ribonuclease P protein component
MSFRFGPDVRLRASAEFGVVQKTGRRVPARFLTLLVKPNMRSSDRLGVIASRRLGPSVVRNRAKRRVRELFRQRQPDALPAGAVGFDVVVIPRRELASAPFALIADDFRRAFGRIRGGRDA